MSKEACSICGNDKSLALIGKALGFRPDIMAAEIRKLREELAQYESDTHVMVPRERLKELFEHYHNERYNPVSEHYRFEHFYGALTAAQRQEKE